jgi:hypothetical protein
MPIKECKTADDPGRATGGKNRLGGDDWGDPKTTCNIKHPLYGETGI